MSIEMLARILTTVDGGVTIVVMLYLLRQIRQDVQTLLSHQWALINKLTDNDDEL